MIGWVVEWVEWNMGPRYVFARSVKGISAHAKNRQPGYPGTPYGYSTSGRMTPSRHMSTPGELALHFLSCNMSC